MLARDGTLVNAMEQDSDYMNTAQVEGKDGKLKTTNNESATQAAQWNTKAVILFSELFYE
ncbi:hypothetical protein BOTCAL_0079g00100 [Botryotinia calthae]|uniref:Uncharacterized protein n=1 Tax=Botryotinia calthae TaxID=38488 RepID=A0A4Y8D821_9HELO|nr:hypothetical protein BOTCAL_0079g00100 [Botryotinia calthae]